MRNNWLTNDKREHEERVYFSRNNESILTNQKDENHVITSLFIVEQLFFFCNFYEDFCAIL